MIQEKIFGNIGLNLDDDPRYFGDDDTDLIQNMLPDMDGDGGLLATHPGNLEIPTGINWLITATQKVIGSCKRIENDTIYYFVKGLSIHGSDITTTTTTSGFDYDDSLDNEYNSIIEFNPLTETFRVIVFEEEFLYMGDWVYGAKVFGEYIIYNSGAHGMRKVHIEYAYRYYNSIPLLPTYPTITSTTFALRNLPPMDRPTVAYGTDVSKIMNLLSDKTFQFAYRYKYVDGGFSVYSQPSDICLFPTADTYNGELIGNIYDNNLITVGFERGDLDIIEYVEVIVREGNDGDWKFIKAITDTSNTIDFYNDEKYESVDQDEVLKVEDAIPLQVADGTLINDNRIVVGGITEGFANIDIDVSMLVGIEDITLTAPESAIINTVDIFGENYEFSSYSLNTSDLDNTDYADDDIIRYTIGGDFGPIEYDHTIIAADRASVTALATVIATDLATLLAPHLGINGVWVISGGQPAIDAVLNNDNDDIEIDLDGTAMGIWGTVQFIDHTVASTINKWNTYKSGAVHPHGIEYFDEEFRRSTVQRSDDCEVFVPERGALGGGSLLYHTMINWTISHLAPSWARYWRWVYAGNKTQSSFVQYTIFETPTASTDYPGNLEINISPLQLLKTDQAEDISLPDTIIDPYEFVPGDRVRIITGTEDGAGGLGTPLSGGSYYDLPIMGISGNSILVPAPNAGTYNAGTGSLVEIYTPRTFIEESELYFPVGPIEEVIDQYHMSSLGVNQTAIVSASGTLESGDAYLIGRAFSRTPAAATDGDLFPVESMHWSDFYISDAYDRGKPNLYSSLGEVTQNNIRWGNKHLTGQSANNMFTFDALDYKPTTEIYGDIVRLGEVGDVLKVIFERKVASMYIGKSEIIDTNGSAVLSVADNILSNPNYSLEDYGTTIPQAVIFIRGYCYFIDLYTGSIIRNSNNGSYPISGKADAGGEGADYKMHRYFRDLCSAVLRNEEAYTMLLGWDDGRKLLYVSIMGGSEERTLAFRESRGRWVAFLDFYEDLTGYYPTCYEWAGDKFYSFLNYSDSVWDHSNALSTPLEIYGEAKTARVSVWGQQHPNKVKVFDSISIHTDIKEWAGNVYIPASLSYPDGMESRLPQSMFVRRENGLHASYLFNGLTDNGTFAPQRLYNGESLRGYMINNELYTTEEAKLFKVDINFRISNV